MSQLPNEDKDGVQAYGDDEKSSVVDKAEADKTKENLLAIKESLLHLLSIDALVSTRLHDDLTVIQLDFKFFGPSLPHAAIFTTFRFLASRRYGSSFSKYS